jgi:hypothetical protein
MSKIPSIGYKWKILSCPALEMLADASGIDCAFASRLLRGPPWSEQNFITFAQSGKFRHTLTIPRRIAAIPLKLRWKLGKKLYFSRSLLKTALR